jgi:hypothetical protein
LPSVSPSSLTGLEKDHHARLRRRHPAPAADADRIEQATLLKVTGEHRDGFRDHVIFAVALGTGLREHEIAALDVGDVLHEDGRVRRRIALRTFKCSSTEPATQEVFIPDNLFYKLGKLVSWKRGSGGGGVMRCSCELQEELGMEAQLAALVAWVDRLGDAEWLAARRRAPPFSLFVPHWQQQRRSAPGGSGRRASR